MSDLAHAIREELRGHAGCLDSCHLADLRAEDIDEILSLALVVASRDQLEGLAQAVRDEILRRRLIDLEEE